MDGYFNMELFRAFSSMNGSKGLPKEEEVKKVVGWEVWKLDGDFNMELFRAFSSMNHGKGLPKEADIKRVKDWDVWKVNGHFNMELFRAFSSMNNGKGLPTEEEIKKVMGWEVWKLDGHFNIKLLRIFSSMNSGRGLPTEEEVKKVMGWEVCKLDGHFNVELFQAFSSMNHRRGLPKEEEVKKVMGWEVWKPDSHFNMQLLRAFSSMNHCKGFPKEKDVQGVLDWIGGKQSLQALMCKLWASEGPPALNSLIDTEEKVNVLFTEHIEVNEESEVYEENEEERMIQIKMVVLFLTTRKPQWCLCWDDLKLFHENAEGKKRELEELIKLLVSYGGKGVRDYLAADNTQKSLLLSCTNERVPLFVLNKAMAYFSSVKDRKKFVVFNKKLKSLPSKEKWEWILCQLEKLSGVLKYDYTKKNYWKLLQPFSCEDQDYFLGEDNVKSIFNLFPTTSSLKKLSKVRTLLWFKQLLQACIELKDEKITREGIQKLFEALLIIKSPLYLDDEIPDHFLSGMSETDNQSVLITMDFSNQPMERWALYFIKVVMKALDDMFFTIKEKCLNIEELGIEEEKFHRFPMPMLTINDDSIEIKNWTLEQFMAFVKLIDLPERYYFSKEQCKAQCEIDNNPLQSLYVQIRMAAIEERKLAAREGRPGVSAFSAATEPFKPIPFWILTNLIKENVIIKPLVWKLLDFYKKRLPKSMHGKILEKMEGEKTGCPEETKESLKNYFASIQSGESEKCTPEKTVKKLPCNNSNSCWKESFDRVWKRLSCKGVFSTEIMMFLEAYKDYMGLDHTVLILSKADVHIDDSIMKTWRCLIKQKIDQQQAHDPFFIKLDSYTYDILNDRGFLDF